MSDEDEQQLISHMISQAEIADRRRLAEIKVERQGLMRQKKKYDEEKLNQEKEFVQSEINDLRAAICNVNREINYHTQIKKKLNVQMTNLRSRSRLRYTSLAAALRDKRRFEAELKKEHKTEEYRALAQREIRSIEAAIPILKEEDEYKASSKMAEDAQQTATNKRKKLEEDLNKYLRKQAEIKQMLNERTEKLSELEAATERLRYESEHLSTSINAKPNGNRKDRRRLHSNQQKVNDGSTTAAGTSLRSLLSLEAESLENEKATCEDQLNKVNMLISYCHDKLVAHGLDSDQIPATPSTESHSLPCHSVMSHEEQTVLSPFTEDPDTENVHLLKVTTNQSTSAIAVKVPRDISLALDALTTNETIHSPYDEGNKIQYKKEFSADILDKYGGQPKKGKKQNQQLQNGKKHKKHRKNFSITHNPQMITLYDHVRSSTGNCDTLPSMPMYEYELVPTIEALQLLKQSFESYLNELSYRHQNGKISLTDDEQQSKSGIDNDDEIQDSALDSFSEASSFTEPTNTLKLLPKSDFKLMNILEVRSSLSAEDKRGAKSSSSPNQGEPKANNLCFQNSQTLAAVDELNSRFSFLLLQNTQIDRQMSDEGYRSVLNEQPQQQTQYSKQFLITDNPCLPLLTRSKSYDCTKKVDRWLSTTTPLASSVPSSIYHNRNCQSAKRSDQV